MNSVELSRFGFAMLWLLVGCSARDGVMGSKGPQAPTNLVSVKTVQVTALQSSRTTVQPASVEAFYRAAIRAKVSGYIQELRVEIGDIVEAGMVLAHIDVPELQMQRQILEAKVARAQAEEVRSAAGVELSAANLRSALAELERSKSEVERVQASVAAAESEFSRTNDLVQRQTLQRRVLDEVRLTRDSQLASKSAVQAAITSAEAQVEVAKAEKLAAEANLLAAKADTQIALKQTEELLATLQFATLTAPFSGVVTQRNISPGDLVNEQSSQALLEISQVDKVRVTIALPETEAALVQIGDQVDLTFPSFAAEEKLVAAVTRFSGALDASTRSMTVEVELENSQRKLLPGMFGQATVTLASNQMANTLPARAIRFDDSGKAYVYVVDAADVVSKVAVATGSDDGSAIEVLSGVEQGQRVVDANLHRFTDGQKVAVLNN